MKNYWVGHISFGCSRYEATARRVVPPIGTRWRWGGDSAPHQPWAARSRRLTPASDLSAASGDRVRSGRYLNDLIADLLSSAAGPDSSSGPGWTHRRHPGAVALPGDGVHVLATRHNASRWYAPMATSNCSTCGHPNCSRQDGRIMQW